MWQGGRGWRPPGRPSQGLFPPCTALLFSLPKSSLRHMTAWARLNCSVYTRRPGSPRVSRPGEPENAGKVTEQRRSMRAGWGAGSSGLGPPPRALLLAQGELLSQRSPARRALDRTSGPPEAATGTQNRMSGSLGNSVPSETSQLQKDKHRMMSLIRGPRKSQMQRDRK